MLILHRKIWVPGLLLLLAASVTGVLVWRHRMSPYHFEVVTPGVLYRSGFLRPRNLRKVVNEYGIHTVVDLCTPREKKKKDWTWPQEIQICKRMKLNLIQMPIPDDTPPSARQVTRWLHLFEDPAARPILVHCDHGVIRTGMLVALYQMEFLGWPNRQALARMPMYGHDRYVPKRKAMRNFLLHYRCRTTAAAIRPHH